MISADTRLKANILKAVIDRVTGGECVLEDRESSIKIILSEKQIAWFQQFLNAQLDMKKKPDIEIDALGIILPVVIKRTWPILAAAGGGLAALILRKEKAS
jgi:hypothetical protein